MYADVFLLVSSFVASGICTLQLWKSGINLRTWYTKTDARYQYSYVMYEHWWRISCFVGVSFSSYQRCFVLLWYESNIPFAVLTNHIFTIILHFWTQPSAQIVMCWQVWLRLKVSKWKVCWFLLYRVKREIELFCLLCNYCNTLWKNIKCGIQSSSKLTIYDNKN